MISNPLDGADALKTIPTRYRVMSYSPSMPITTERGLRICVRGHTNLIVAQEMVGPSNIVAQRVPLDVSMVGSMTWHTLHRLHVQFG